MKKFDPIEIDWIDSTRHEGWTLKKDIEYGEIECKAIGYFLHKDKKVIAICQGTAKDEVLSILEIPLKAVKKVRRV
jgi:hypothetical protein